MRSSSMLSWLELHMFLRSSNHTCNSNLAV
jgi:hypothetical protein